MIISNPADHDVQKEIIEFINLPYEFTGFLEFDNLTDGNLQLKCLRKTPGDDLRNWVPSYHFAVLIDNQPIGEIDLRIGYTEGLYYGGNIGYAIDEAYRGHNYAPRACKLIKVVARAHKMEKLNISNEYKNFSSKRVCEKICARFVRVVVLPEENDMRKDGHEFENIFVWDLLE